MKKVKIGTATVPVVDGRAAAVFSSGEHGIKEAGTYLFWTAICLVKGEPKTICGRALKHLDAGDRFRRIGVEQKTAGTKADRAAYRRLWKRLQFPLYVRPSEPNEVAHWLTTHPKDAPYLKSLRFTARAK